MAYALRQDEQTCLYYTLRQGGHIYVYQLDFEDESLLARVVVRSFSHSAGGLFLVGHDGSLQPVIDTLGFGGNPLRQDGLWPLPPREAIDAARTIARQQANRAS